MDAVAHVYTYPNDAIVVLNIVTICVILTMVFAHGQSATNTIVPVTTIRMDPLNDRLT